MATLTLKAPPKALPPLLVAARERAEAKARAREAEAAACQAAEAAEAERQRDELRRERRTRKKQHIDQTIRDLRARWPDAFAHPVPLAVGIREQIRAGMPDLPEATLKRALRHWTRTLTYLAATAEGQPRRNLDGSEAGLPEEDQRDLARLILERWAARREAGS